ncbi:MAG: hypothetical protein DMF54_10130 [Acidobacteria bacterium]|nr:MAG: hypothetical protein DMF55_04755 [Acidobacteriota bacterium]PYQ65745.1 MAG: hypothetical protein DMF54_10130 [Acidobacteriota bacterium]
MPAERARPVLFFLIGAAVLIALGAFWLPRWWENREGPRAEAIAGADSRILPGSLAEARKRIDPGMTGARVTDAIGKPSFSVRTQGVSAHDIWTYYFTDGTLTINLTDGYVARVATEFGPPRPGRPRRP